MISHPSWKNSNSDNGQLSEKDHIFTYRPGFFTRGGIFGMNSQIKACKLLKNALKIRHLYEKDYYDLNLLTLCIYLCYNLFTAIH